MGSFRILRLQRPSKCITNIISICFLFENKTDLILCRMKVSSKQKTTAFWSSTIKFPIKLKIQSTALLLIPHSLSMFYEFIISVCWCACFTRNLTFDDIVVNWLQCFHDEWVFFSFHFCLWIHTEISLWKAHCTCHWNSLGMCFSGISKVCQLKLTLSKKYKRDQIEWMSRWALNIDLQENSLVDGIFYTLLINGDKVIIQWPR